MDASTSTNQDKGGTLTAFDRTDPNKGFYHGWTYEVGPDGVKRKVKKPKPSCRCGCGRMPPKGRRTFFGDDCVHRWKIRTDPGYVRQQLLQRDHGVCSRCGLDTLEVRQAVDELIRERYRGGYDNLQGYAYGQLGRQWLHDQKLVNRKSFWEAHHEVAVVEGGGLCDLSGFATVCVWCHRRESAALAKRRAEKRKLEKTDGPDAGL